MDNSSKVPVCASYDFAFINFLNPEQSNSEDVSFSMPGRAWQDVLSFATVRASPEARGQH